MHVSRRTMLAGFIGLVSRTVIKGASTTWAAYYSAKPLPTTCGPLGTLILDSRYYPPLKPLTDAGMQLIGYVSLGEVSSDYSYFNQLKAEGLLIRPNPNWPGNYSVDIRDPRWRQRLCHQIIPDILAQGFHGIFLDTLDTPLYLEDTEPRLFAGMRVAAINLVREIRRSVRSSVVVMNRAYSILDDVAGELHAEVGESVFTTYDFAKKEYRFVDSKAYRDQVSLLTAAADAHPGLQIFTLDYWNPEDTDQIRAIYREERSNGFSPYVSSIDLTSLVCEPHQ